MQCQVFRGLFRSHLDYVDIICDNPNNINICNKIEIIQYNASLTITPQTQDVSWTYIRRSEDVPDVFWTSYIRSIYVQCLRVIKLSKEKLYQELGFEYLSSRRWLRKRCLFYKAVVSKSPNYLYNYVSTVNPIKLEAVTNFYICVEKQNILWTLSFCTQSRDGII